MKKKVGLALSLVLALGLVVGGTLALFSSNTNTLKNTFTVGTGVSLDIKEPTWDGEDFDGTTTLPEDQWGKNQATEFSPLDAINKDPQVKNTSDKVNVFAAVEITYTNDKTSAPMDYATLSALATVDFNTTDWEIVQVGNKTVAYYKTALAPGEKTNPVFTKVTIGKDVDENSPNFTINATGYAVQEQGDESIANIKAVINASFDSLTK